MDFNNDNSSLPEENSILPADDREPGTDLVVRDVYPEENPAEQAMQTYNDLTAGRIIFSYGPYDDLVKNIVNSARNAGIDDVFIAQVQGIFHEAASVVAASQEPGSYQARLNGLQYAVQKIAERVDHDLLANMASGATREQINALSQNQGPDLVGAALYQIIKHFRRNNANQDNQIDGSLNAMSYFLNQIETKAGDPAWESSIEGKTAFRNLNKSIESLNDIDSHRLNEPGFMQMMQQLRDRLDKVKNTVALDTSKNSLENMMEMIERIRKAVAAVINKITNRFAAS
jgi:hypothetical protein